MRRYRKPRAPKPPKPPKIKAPKIYDLRKVMRGLISVDPIRRTVVLTEILQWYDQAFQGYILLKRKGQLTLEQAKWYDTAAKCRMLGSNAGATAAERENALEKSVRLYEKLVQPELTTPSIAQYYGVLDQKADRLKARQEKLQARYDKFVQLIMAALKPEDKQGGLVTMQIGVGGNDAIQIDPSMSIITIRRDYAKKLFKKMRREGLYCAILELLDPLSQLPAYEAETDGMGQMTGRLLLAKGKQIAAIHKLLKNFADFAKTAAAPKRLVRQPLQIPAQAPGQPSPIQRSKRHFGPRKGPKTGGLFAAGTDIAFVYTALEDYQWHNKADIQSKITAQLSNRLRVLQDRGIRSGRFKVEETADQVRLVPLTLTPPSVVP